MPDPAAVRELVNATNVGCTRTSGPCCRGSTRQPHSRSGLSDRTAPHPAHSGGVCFAGRRPRPTGGCGAPKDPGVAAVLGRPVPAACRLGMPILDQCDRRPAAFCRGPWSTTAARTRLLREPILGRAWTIEQIAELDGSPARDVARDLSGCTPAWCRPCGTPLCRTPVRRRRAGRPTWAGWRSSLLTARSPTTVDSVVETLLLGDTAAQAHYHRNAALVADLDWDSAAPVPARAAGRGRRRALGPRMGVTIAFVVAVLAVVGFAVSRLAGYP